MAAVKGLLLGLADDLEGELRHYHAAAQARRLAGVFLGALVLQLVTSGTAGWTWKSLGSLLLAAGYATWRQLEPTMPWALVQKTVLSGGGSTPQDAPTPAAPPHG